MLLQQPLIVHPFIQKYSLNFYCVFLPTYTSILLFPATPPPNLIRASTFWDGKETNLLLSPNKRLMNESYYQEKAPQYNWSTDGTQSM
jgi:hypothetical protein